MNDPYRITDAPRQAGTDLPRQTGGGPSHTTDPDRVGPSSHDRDRVSGLLWAALAVLVALNAASSVVSPNNLLPSLVFGLGAVVCVGVLVARYLGRRQA